MAFPVRCQQPPGPVKWNVTAQAGEGIRQPPVPTGGMERRIACHHRKAQVAGQIDKVAVESAIVPQPVPMQLDENIFPTKGSYQPLRRRQSGFPVIPQQRFANRAIAPACESDQMAGVTGKLMVFLRQQLQVG